MLNIVLLVIITVAFLLLLACSIYFLIVIRKITTIVKATKIAITNGSNSDTLNHKTVVYPTSLSSGFSYEVAYFCAILIGSLKNIHKTQQCGMAVIFREFEYVYFEGNVIGFCAVGSGDIGWICFRGTRFRSEWEKNFNADQKQINGQMCAAGFVEIFATLSGPIRKITEKWPIERKIIVTGHSLGGALALLTSIQLQKSTKLVYTYLFAAPRVCEFNSLDFPVNCFRIDNTCDIVPNLPLSTTPNMKKPNQPLKYQHTGTHLTFTENRGGLGNSHLMPVFINAIINRTLLMAVPVS